MSGFPNSITEEQLLEQTGFIRALARQLVQAEDLANDLGQEACLAALEHPPQDRADLRPWLVRVLRNRAHKDYRSRIRRKKREREAVRGDEVPRPEDLLAQKELLTQMLQAVRALPEPIARTIHLRYYLDMTPSNIAAQDDLSVATVKSRLKRGLQLLRVDLDRRQNGGRRAWSLALLPLAGVSPTTLQAKTTASSVAGTLLSMPTAAKIVLTVALVLVGSLSILDPFEHEQLGGIEVDVAPANAAPASSQEMVRALGGAQGGALDQGKRVPVDAAHYARGVVRDEKGKPIEGMKLRLLHGKNLKTNVELTTDPEGRFGMDFTGPERFYVFLDSPFFKTNKGPSGVLQSPLANLDFVVERYATGFLEIRLRGLSSGKLLPTFHATAQTMIRLKELPEGHAIRKEFQERWEKFGIEPLDLSRISSSMLAVGDDATKGLLLLEVPLADESWSWPVRVKTKRCEKWVRLKAGQKLQILLGVHSLKIEGRVLDSRGQPIADALVYSGNQMLARGDEPFKPFDEQQIHNGVRSGKDGRFVILGTDRSQQVTAWHPAFTVRTVSREDARVIRLLGRGTIQGVLVDEMGQPQAETEICMDRTHIQETNAKGRFVFKNAETGLRALWVVKPGTSQRQLGKIRMQQGPWIVKVKAEEIVSVRLDPKRFTFIDGWTSKPILVEPGLVIPKIDVEFRSHGKRIDKSIRGMLWSYDRGTFKPRAFEANAGLLALENLRSGRYPITTTTGWYLLDVKGPRAELELGTADLSVTGKPGTRIRFYRTGSDLLVRTLSGRIPGSWNRIPPAGTLLLPYLQAGTYDICIGDMVFRKRIQVSGKGTRLQLD